jgi:hypothetical protein
MEVVAMKHLALLLEWFSLGDSKRDDRWRCGGDGNGGHLTCCVILFIPRRIFLTSDQHIFRWLLANVEASFLDKGLLVRGL